MQRPYGVFYFFLNMAAALNFKFQAALKWKERSEITYWEDHVVRAKALEGPVNVLIIGSSLSERLITTHGVNVVPSTWFVAGVSGDKIENLLYRLSLPELWQTPALQKVQHVVFWIGSNNLKPNMRDKDYTDMLEKYKILILYLQHYYPAAKIAGCLVTCRTDILPAVIDQVNQGLKVLCANQHISNIDLHVTMDNLLDHVHFKPDSFTHLVQQIDLQK